MKKIFLFTVLIVLSLTSCKKDEEGENITPEPILKVQLTDAPGDYKHIILEVEEVDVRTAGNWQSMSLNQTDTFDILDYTNGNKLLLADAQLNAGTVDEIRLVLGDSNKLVLEDGSIHQLKVPSGSSSGLKIKLDEAKNLDQTKTYYVVLDFDADKSIVKKGNGDYSLKPVIRGFWEEGKGAVDGYAISTGFQVTARVINGIDTLGSSITNSDGYYLISGLPAATYRLHYSSTNGKDTSIQNLNISQNTTLRVDSVDLN